MLTAPTFAGRARPDLKPIAGEPGYYTDERGGIYQADSPTRKSTGSARRRSRTPQWPEPPGAAAHHGLVGEFVRTIAPHSEADSAALLISYIVAFGNAVGRGPGVHVEGDFHGPNLNTLVVGDTAKGRKGTSWSRVRQVVELADPEWTAERILGGLSSGEGVVWAVRDPIVSRRKARNKAEREEADADGYVADEDDPGVMDKRALVVESEFAQALRVMRREGNTLSPTLRNLWDRGSVGTLTKNSPARTTGAHVSILGHITSAELRRELTTTDAANGFANRFLFVCAKRSKALPFGGNLDMGDLERLGRRTGDALQRARGCGAMAMTAGGARAWAAAYRGSLAMAHPGLLGSVTSRSEAQALRLAVVYALLDGARSIGPEHVAAALAVWEYSVRSAACVFSRATGDTDADKALETITATEGGLTRNELRDEFGRNWSAGRLDGALDWLLNCELIYELEEQTGGRPATRYLAREMHAVNAESPPEGDTAYTACVARTQQGSGNGDGLDDLGPEQPLNDPTRDAVRAAPCTCGSRSVPTIDEDGERRCIPCGKPTEGW